MSRGRYRQRTRERGSAAIEAVLTLPALMLLVVGGIQFAIYGLASHALAAAVAEGGAEARSAGGSVQEAERMVQSETRLLAGGLLVHPKFSVREQAGAEMVVTGSSEVSSIFPGLHLVIHSTSDGPVQQFRPGG